MAIYIPNSQSQSMKTTPILTKQSWEVVQRGKKKNPNPNHPLWIYLNNLRVVLITDQFPSKLPQKWILLPSYTEPTVSQQCGISLHPKPHSHEKPIWKPLKSSSFSPIGPYTMHFNLSTFDRENTKPSTQHTFMIVGHSSLTKITN